MSKIKNVLSKLNIEHNKFTTIPKKEKQFTHVKENIPLRQYFNYVADVLFLPETQKGYKYLLVCVDLATDLFDMIPMKTKSSNEVIKAFNLMFKNKYIHKPQASIRTDAGTEFKGSFNKYLYDNNIIHRVALPARHKQMANVESLNKQLGAIFNAYMNKKEIETGEQYNEWIDIIDDVRKELNNERVYKPALNKKTVFKQMPNINVKNMLEHEPLYKVGDLVHVKLERPKNSLNNYQNTAKFREGDTRWDILPRKIIKVLYYVGRIPYRYIVDGIKNASYTENELMKSTDKEQKYFIKAILDKKMINKTLHYLIHWKGYKKSQSSWEPATSIKHDAPLLVQQFEQNYNK